ncbi:hypothetical protein [Paenibacillus prosopidis]|uniref:Butirosin biosynthesis protein H-like n=1 Tax=Paenibacillus prosopidis TaxID=630520 RepID=A0A368VR49_9BACL|nr:hypothetical protein [Paenibacillus prosopidis]RCW43495.1 hypothetical protein DFP97_113168 [Paenibacillus prosopidis]
MLKQAEHCLYACAAYSLHANGCCLSEAQIYFRADGPLVEYASDSGVLYPPALDRMAASWRSRLPVSVHLQPLTGEILKTVVARAESGAHTLLIVDSRSLSYKPFYIAGESRDHTVVLLGLDRSRGVARVADLFLLEPTGAVCGYEGETDWGPLSEGVRHALWFGDTETNVILGEKDIRAEEDMTGGLRRFFESESTPGTGLSAYRQWLESLALRADSCANDSDLPVLCQQAHYRLRIGSIYHLLQYTKSSLGPRKLTRYEQPLLQIQLDWKRTGATIFKAGVKKDKKALRFAAETAVGRLEALRGLLVEIAEACTTSRGSS